MFTGVPLADKTNHFDRRVGFQQIHISTRKPLSNRGKKFSLPKPKGGKYAVNPILSADQPIPQQKRSSMAIAKTNALNEDYTAGKSFEKSN